MSLRLIPNIRIISKSVNDSVNGLALNRIQAFIGNNDGLVYWCIYSSLSLHDLIHGAPFTNMVQF